MIRMSRFAGRIKPFIILVSPLIIGGIILLYRLNTNVDFLTAVVTLSYFVISEIVALVYGAYPAFVKAEKLFNNRDTKKIFEHRFVKRFLFVMIPLMVVSYLVFFIPTSPAYIYGYLEKVTDPKTLPIFYLFDRYFFLIYYIGLIEYLTIGGILRLVTQMIKVDFRLYIARLYSVLILQTEDDLVKMKYLQSLIDSYDKYLRRNMKMAINTRIYSKIMDKQTKQEDDEIGMICKHIEGDKLDLARYISSTHTLPDLDFYIRESLQQKLKTVGVILSTAIPIIISLITLPSAFSPKPP